MRHCGHLYSALESGGDHPALTPFSDTQRDWSDHIRPTLGQHFAEFAALADKPAWLALTRARDLFAECIALHHALLLPARRQVDELLSWIGEIATARTDPMRLRHAVLQAVGHVGSATHLAAARLVEAAPNDAMQAIAEGACDGDGLTQPGWLDDAHYARRIHRLLSRFGVDRAWLRRQQKEATGRRDDAISALRDAIPGTAHRELGRRVNAACAGSAVAESHGPLMHVRYLHEMRCLSLHHGKRLRDSALIAMPEHLLHLSLNEVEAPEAARIACDRSVSYHNALHAPLPPPTLQQTGAAKALPTQFAARLDQLGTSPGTRTGPGIWQATGASRGNASGRLRVLRTQSDIDRLMPGDIAVVSDSGPAWGWLTVAGIAVIVEHGGLLGHTPALARESGTACVVGGYGLSDLVGEDHVVKVSGDTGEVAW